MDAGEAGLKGGTTAERDRAADLFVRHSAGIYRYCLSRLHSPEEAEDALQLTYLNAWRSVKKGFQPENARPWLFQIAANVCSDTLRQKLGGRKLELRDPGALDELAALQADDSDELLGLADAVRDLPERQRRALVLRDLRGLSYDEIATEMEVSDSAVETLLFRARRTVATSLAAGEWRRKVAASARALVVLPFASMHVRSSTSTGAGHLKAGLTIAVGATAPLAAFGIFQALATSAEPATAAGHATPSPVVENRTERPAEELVVRQRAAAERSKRAPHAISVVRRPSKKHPTHARGPHETPSPHGSAEPPRADPAQSMPAPVTVTLCHATHSAKNPGVTITVSAHARRAHRTDAAGGCS